MHGKYQSRQFLLINSGNYIALQRPFHPFSLIFLLFSREHTVGLFYKTKQNKTETSPVV